VRDDWTAAASCAVLRARKLGGAPHLRREHIARPRQSHAFILPIMALRVTPISRAI